MTLYDDNILPIVNYGAAVWGYADYPAPKELQNKIVRFYSDVDRFAPVACTNIEMDWSNIRYMRWMEMLHFHNRLMNTKPHHCPGECMSLTRFMSNVAGSLMLN